MINYWVEVDTAKACLYFRDHHKSNSVQVKSAERTSDVSMQGFARGAKKILFVSMQTTRVAQFYRHFFEGSVDYCKFVEAIFQRRLCLRLTGTEILFSRTT
ncbi:hypothetical protein KC19_2G246900 [Ceratodon purpureus]|uniref:Uncharacterized protein n=1 Tax=Ceratodon purpureus TaxID=3225 RepID=A0A8T0IXN0_CERPU|nr:hypothetical protein KC19_2G246900 [Ceratodon purpureus]